MFPTTPETDLKDVTGSLPSDNVPQDVDLADLSTQAQKLLSVISTDSLVEDALWRDWMGMHATVRTINTAEKISQIWKERSEKRQISNLQILPGATVMRPLPGVSWVDVPFSFMTQQSQSGNLEGIVSGTASLVRVNDNEWRVWMLVTILESFVGQKNPDELVPVDSPALDSTLHPEQVYFVAIVGAGQAGLSLAGRLQALDISYVLIERNKRIGDNWTSRYDSIRQHTTKEMNNLPGDRTWKMEDPDLLSGQDVARGYQEYVKKYGLNICLRTTLEQAEYDEVESIWTLTLRVSNDDGGCTQLTCRCRHLALAMGGTYAVPRMPDLKNRKMFQGTAIHSSEFANAAKWKGKKGIVVGSGVSAHDIAQDMLDNGLLSVTMLQRSPTIVAPFMWVLQSLTAVFNNSIPMNISDRIAAGPFKVMTEISGRSTLLEADRDPSFWDNLEHVGFLVDRRGNMFDNALAKMQGFYVDIGTSKRIMSGHIKIISQNPPVSFTKYGLKLQDGTELEAELVVLATGFERDYRVCASRFIGEELAARCAEQMGLDQDGEFRGLYDPVAKNLWSLAGSAIQARWNSRFIALKLQVEELGQVLNSF